MSSSSPESVDPQFDRHGFIISEKREVSFHTCDDSPGNTPSTDQCSCGEINSSLKKQSIIKKQNLARSYSYTVLESWRNILDQWPDKDIVLTNQLYRLVKKGVPPSIRSEYWKTLLDIKQLQASSNFNYQAQLSAVREQLVELEVTEFGGKKSADCLNDSKETNIPGCVPVVVLRQIFLDLDRTFPTHKLYCSCTPQGIEGQAMLFRVLALYARYNKDVGYTQGMSYIVGLLLMYLDEEEAFWCFVSLMERPKYLMGYFDCQLSRIHRHGAIFQQLMLSRLPRLARHFEKVGLEPLMFITQWFMSLYTNTLPSSCWDTLLTIWDLIILEGVTVIFRVALTILKTFEEELWELGSLGLMLPSLLSLPPHIGASEVLIPKLYETEVEHWEIDSLQAIVDEKSKKSRKRHFSPEQSSHSNSKRNRTMDIDPQKMGKMWNKFVNMFTPKNSDETIENQDKSLTPKLPRKLLQLGGSLRLTRTQTSLASSCEEDKENSVVPEVKSSPITERIVTMSARDRHIFRQFNTPYRRSPRCVRSPVVVELQYMKI